MRHIRKQPAPDAFQRWKREFRPKKGKQLVFGDLKGAPHVKSTLHKSLIGEQFGVCCYCGIRIDETNSHIEHLKPKSHKVHKQEQLNYNNLLASCLKTRDAEDELRCGHHKDRWYDDDLFVSPLDPDCEGYFRYTEAGKILPPKNEFVRQQKAETTIEKLNLNSYKLTTLRGEAIFSVLYAEERPLSKEELQNMIRSYQQPNEHGQLEEFCTAIIFMLEQELSRISTATTSV